MICFKKEKGWDNHFGTTDWEEGRLLLPLSALILLGTGAFLLWKGISDFITEGRGRKG